MCAIFRLSQPKESDLVRQVVERYGEDAASSLDGDIFPKYRAPAIGAGGKVALLKWGFPVSGKKSVVFNARAEGLAQKRMFRGSICNRCLIPATAFYEFGEINGGKHKFIISPGKAGIFYMAALWNGFLDENGVKRYHFVIITTKPNEQIGWIHSRMPALIPEESCRSWLDQKNDPDEFLGPYTENLVIETAD